MIQIIDQIDTSQLETAYHELESKILWEDYLHKGKQSGLQYKTDADPFLSAVGRNFGFEQDFNLINPLYQNTIFEQVIKKYNLYRTRFIWLGSNACYTFHKDTTPRVHIPIITNPHAYLIFKNSIMQNLKIGQVYWTDTRLEHTAINGDHNWRLHLVGAVTK